MIERLHHDEMEDKLIVETVYDNSEVLSGNLQEQKEAKEIGQGRYKGNLVRVGSIHEGDIIRLKNKGYNLMSGNQDEVRRALCYIQTEEPWLLTVPGKPFARQRKKWA